MKASYCYSQVFGCDEACFLGVEKGEDEVDVFFAVVLEQPWGHEMEKLIEVYLAVAFAIEI